MKNKQKQLKIKEKKEDDALKVLKKRVKRDQLKEFFQNIMKVMKLKMNCMKLEDMKIKLLEIISFMNGGRRDMILTYFKQ